MEDTSAGDIRLPSGNRSGWAPSPRIELEVADCDSRIRLYFDLEDAEDRMNSFHKIDTLISALTAFRVAMVEEASLRRARLRVIDQAGLARFGDYATSAATACGATVVELPAA